MEFPVHRTGWMEASQYCWFARNDQQPTRSPPRTTDYHQKLGAPSVRTTIFSNLRHSTWPSSMLRFPPNGVLLLRCAVECGFVPPPHPPNIFVKLLPLG